MKRMLVALVFLFAALSLLIGTPALSSRVSGLTKALKQLPPDDLQEVFENLEFAPVPKTGAIYDDPLAIGDDGELRMGVAWPVPRFTDNNDGTVTDNLTGLVWTKNADIFYRKGWDDACWECDGLNSGEEGLSDGSVEGDWRLPNIKEFLSLVDYGRFQPALPRIHPFVGVQQTAYWSSTNLAFKSASAWYVDFTSGSMFTQDKSASFYVWCVRDSKWR